MTSPVRVVTVVLNYRHVDDTVRCVRSLRAGDFGDQRILVVDNAEHGPTTDALRRELDPEVTVVASGGNLGYAGGNNVGITWALQQQPDFVWLINPDAVADQGTLSALVEAADAHPDAGVVGCRIVHGGSNPPRIASNGGKVDAKRWGATPLRDSGRLDSEVVESGVRDVGFVSGACILLRTELIRELGMLPEEYFLYFEETDYCVRAQRAGWRTVVTTDTRIWHYKRSTEVLPSAYYLYYMCRNRIHFGRRHFDATADDVIADLAPFLNRLRRRIKQDFPELLGTFEDIVARAFEDGRSGVFGRMPDIETIPFTPGPVRALKRGLSCTAVADRTARDRYLDLMAAVLTRYGFEGTNTTVTLPTGSYPAYLWDMLRAELGRKSVRIMEGGTFDAAKREEGRDWPADAETMIGLRRLANVRSCVETVLADSVPGDLIETGAWRGGSTIYMRAVLAAHEVSDRVVWVADSFQGLPKPDAERYPEDAGDQHYTMDELAISQEQVRENFRRYNLLDDQVRFLPGWFEDTLPEAPIERLAVLRLDGDMYGSTMVALDSLYDKVSPGGFVIVDDFGAVPACARAIEDFRTRRGITDPIEKIDWTGVYWRKS
ncbi:MAG: TylF/MycF/NovP-related O-methyltransferase [Haloechinothrix sp.]